MSDDPAAVGHAERELSRELALILFSHTPDIGLHKLIAIVGGLLTAAIMQLPEEQHEFMLRQVIDMIAVSVRKGGQT